MYQKNGLIVAGIMVIFNVSAAHADANADLQRGIRQLQHNHFREAIECFNRAVAQNPRLDYAYGLRGQAYLELEKRQPAMRDINHAITLNSHNWTYWENRSRLKFELNDLDGAIADATRALQIDPKQDGIYRLRSKYYILKKDNVKALADLTKAIEFQDSHEISSYRNRADLYFNTKKYELAVKDYTTSISLTGTKQKDDRSLEHDYSARANAYEKLGKKQLAAADRKKVQAIVKDGWGAFLYDADK
ncbi:MAG: tetratricopeptide repeat protein [Candidatus Melainabacteria bacterium]|nr:tetratricopeptide repeat protein [Candidatus Melainabacteria bacterium]